MSDLIDRQAAIRAITNHNGVVDKSVAKRILTQLPSAQPRDHDYADGYADGYKQGQKDAQPERLTDDDFETIRIHLNAYKEKLCNQHRWKEAEEYQRIIDRFMSFASAQPEIIHCGECKYAINIGTPDMMCKNSKAWVVATDNNFGCVFAERRTDE